MASQLIQHTDANAFHDAVIDHLLASEAECCTQLGLLRRIVEGYQPTSADELDQPNLWTVQDGSHIEAVAIQTKKKTMLVTRGSNPAMECLADALASCQWQGNCLIGVSPSIEILIHRYAKLSNQKPALAVRLRAFQLDKVIWPTPAAGHMRLCDPADRHTLARFGSAFVEAIGEPRDEFPLVGADRHIAEKRIYFWIDQEPVAMTGWAGPTPNGIRINSVYTPPEHRNRGYASNLVAHLSQQLLDSGRKYCFLFTDQSNPTSNKIYQQIGYRPIADSERWEFSTL